MITKAIIYGKVPQDADNQLLYKYFVWVPLLWGQGQQVPKDMFDPKIMEAAVCSPQGMLPNYVNGDVVYVGFEDDIPNKPVILGALSGRSNDKMDIEALGINSTQESHLSKYTSIGDVTSDDIQAIKGMSGIQLRNLLSIIVKYLNDNDANIPEIS